MYEVGKDRRERKEIGGRRNQQAKIPPPPVNQGVKRG
jgi:hypothetical protein